MERLTRNPSRPAARLAALLLLGAAAVYGAVWPHELGHAAAARLLGCRAGWLPSGVTPWLAGSGPGGIDAACLAARGRGAVAAVALAGIAVNLAVGAAAALAARSRRFGRTSLATFVLLLALAHAAEALSYLVLNALWPRADMAAAVAAAGRGRLPWLALGLAATALAIGALRAPVCEVARALATLRLPARAWRWGLVIYALAVAGVALASRARFG